MKPDSPWHIWLLAWEMSSWLLLADSFPFLTNTFLTNTNVNTRNSSWLQISPLSKFLVIHLPSSLLLDEDISVVITYSDTMLISISKTSKYNYKSKFNYKSKCNYKCKYNKSLPGCSGFHLHKQIHLQIHGISMKQKGPCTFKNS